MKTPRRKISKRLSKRKRTAGSLERVVSPQVWGYVREWKTMRNKAKEAANRYDFETAAVHYKQAKAYADTVMCLLAG